MEHTVLLGEGDELGHLVAVSTGTRGVVGVAEVDDIAVLYPRKHFFSDQ